MPVVLDIETDSADPEKANLKFFGGLDCESKVFTIFNFRQSKEINEYLKKYKYIVGFNFKNFDKVVLERNGYNLNYKVIIDLYQALAPVGDSGFGIDNKDRLSKIDSGLTLKDYKLDTIIQALKLDTDGKIKIDYEIFKKYEWTTDELAEINKYVKQDLRLTDILFGWYSDIFKPLEPYLSKKDVKNYKHLTSSVGTLSYKLMCNTANLLEEYNDKNIATDLKRSSVRVEGGHHIHFRKEIYKGKIVCKDFISHYPHILICYNLLSKDKVEALKKILSERLIAKSNHNKAKDLALKIPLNSIYGTLGNPSFKNMYDPSAAKECTRIGRELLKRYAMSLEIAGFDIVYGFTDSVYVGIPEGLTEKDLDLVTRDFIMRVKKEMPNPIDSFGISTDKVYKLVWGIKKKDNNYLAVEENNRITIKGGLFDVNIPKCIETLFNDYISKKIISDLNIDFTMEELLKKLFEILNFNPELAAEDYNVRDSESYKSKTSLQFQISTKYGSGLHSLIPNTKNIGVGRGVGIRYCTVEEFIKNNLKAGDIHIKRMMRYLEPFYSVEQSPQAT